MKRFASLLIIFLFIFLSGCSSDKIPLDMEPSKDNNASLIYGYITKPFKFGDNPMFVFADVEYVKLKRISPRSHTGAYDYFDLRVEDETFYAEYIPPGIYEFAQVVFETSGDDKLFLTLKPETSPRFEIKSSGFYYFGSYELESESAFMYRQEYIMKRLPDNKNEHKIELLEIILDRAEDTKWEMVVQQELQKTKVSVK